MRISTLKKPKTVQFEPIPVSEVYSTVQMTEAVPVHPVGFLFDYRPDVRAEEMHFHNFFEIGYCESGAGIFIVDGKIIPYSGKCCSMIYPGQVHIAQSAEDNTSLWHFLYIDMSKLMSLADSPSISGLKAANYSNYDFPSLFSYDECPDMYDLIKQILFETTYAREMYRHAVVGFTYALLLKHSRFMRPKPDAGNKLSLTLELGETINYINWNFMNDINIDVLLAVSKMSKSSLQRKMELFTGYSPMQYILVLRLKRASVLLLTSAKSVTEIATSVGFCTLSSFNRHFLSHFGLSPTKYKKTARL
jgi:AraC-like DNA-binding protein